MGGSSHPPHSSHFIDEETEAVGRKAGEGRVFLADPGEKTHLLAPRPASQSCRTLMCPAQSFLNLTNVCRCLDRQHIVTEP